MSTTRRRGRPPKRRNYDEMVRNATLLATLDELAPTRPPEPNPLFDSFLLDGDAPIIRPSQQIHLPMSPMEALKYLEGRRKKLPPSRLTEANPDGRPVLRKIKQYKKAAPKPAKIGGQDLSQIEPYGMRPGQNGTQANNVNGMRVSHETPQETLQVAQPQVAQPQGKHKRVSNLENYNVGSLKLVTPAQTTHQLRVVNHAAKATRKSTIGLSRQFPGQSVLDFSSQPVSHITPFHAVSTHAAPMQSLPPFPIQSVPTQPFSIQSLPNYPVQSLPTQPIPKQSVPTYPIQGAPTHRHIQGLPTYPPHIQGLPSYSPHIPGPPLQGPSTHPPPFQGAATHPPPIQGPPTHQPPTQGPPSHPPPIGPNSLLTHPNSHDSQSNHTLPLINEIQSDSDDDVMEIDNPYPGHSKSSTNENLYKKIAGERMRRPSVGTRPPLGNFRGKKQKSDSGPLNETPQLNRRQPSQSPRVQHTPKSQSTPRQHSLSARLSSTTPITQVQSPPPVDSFYPVDREAAIADTMDLIPITHSSQPPLIPNVSRSRRNSYHDRRASLQHRQNRQLIRGADDIHPDVPRGELYRHVNPDASPEDQFTQLMILTIKSRQHEVERMPLMVDGDPLMLNSMAKSLHNTILQDMVRQKSVYNFPKVNAPAVLLPNPRNDELRKEIVYYKQQLAKVSRERDQWVEQITNIKETTDKMKLTITPPNVEAPVKVLNAATAIRKTISAMEATTDEFSRRAHENAAVVKEIGHLLNDAKPKINQRVSEYMESSSTIPDMLLLRHWCRKASHRNRE